MRIALAVLMALHGIAHLPGFLVTWRLMESPELSYGTTIVGGRLDLGDAGMRVVGIAWLAMALAFVLTAVGTVADRSWWMMAAVLVTALSLALSAVNLPAARIGLAVNLAILAALAVAPGLGWT